MRALITTVTTPMKTAVMKRAVTIPQIAMSGIPTHPKMSPTFPPGSPGTDIVQAFCAHVLGFVNATNVQGVRI
jgi:hypothetical protein